jgi:hypothetical protein
MRKVWCASCSHSRLAKQDVVLALPLQSPALPVEGRTPASWHPGPKVSAVYGQPWSE